MPITKWWNQRVARQLGWLLAALWLTACSTGAETASAPAITAAPDAPVSVEGGTYTNISPGRLVEWLGNKDFFFVNVHIPYEGEIAGTDAQIPYDQTNSRLGDYPADKNAKIVLYCRSGRMSALAAADLVKAGYTQIFNLQGGMVAWEQAGQPLIQQK